jgi:diaminopropionate ammonia-lyase
MPDSAPFRLLLNPHFGGASPAILSEDGYRLARATIVGWPGYGPTPLVDLPELAREGGVSALRIKDESGRFGLGSFKALGGAYAVARLAADRQAGYPRLTVTCATDGNHGRAVAWGAQRFGCDCVIFLHEGVSKGRADAIAAFGAQIRRVPGNYDDSVREANRVAGELGWVVVSDTSWEGYTEVPTEVMQGYRVMAEEVGTQWTGNPPTHVFIQGGVGGVAAAVAVQLRRGPLPSPRVIIVEPERAACLLASAEAGKSVTVGGALDTIMAGLACGEPSLLAWQVLEREAAAFMAIPDELVPPAMRALAQGGVESGESGAAGLAGFLAVAIYQAARTALRLDAESRVLLFSTEGATDPELYRRLIADG